MMIAERLRDEGYAIVGTNVMVGKYELDVVARRGREVVVVEVRSRRDDRFGPPAASIDEGKARRVRIAAWRLLRTTPALRRCRLRIDVAAVTFHPTTHVEYYRDVL